MVIPSLTSYKLTSNQVGQNGHGKSAVLPVIQVGIIINDRVDVALAVGAHGVHVGQDDIPAKTARQLLGPGRVLGVSVKTVAQAQQAAADGADYLGAGASEC